MGSGEAWFEEDLDSKTRVECRLFFKKQESRSNGNDAQSAQIS